MMENDKDLLKFYTRKRAVIGAGTGRLHLIVIGLVFSLYSLAVWYMRSVPAIKSKK